MFIQTKKLSPLILNPDRSIFPSPKMASRRNDSQSNEAYLYYEAVAKDVQEKRLISSFLDLTERVFSECVHNFAVGNLTTKEKTCIANATKKFINVSSRTSVRFSEYQSAFTEHQVADIEKRQAEVNERIQDLKTKIQEVKGR
jgi:Tim10/DDP family zinc finger